MNEVNVNNDLFSSSLITYSNDQLILGQLTAASDIDIYKFQTTMLPTASGVGFDAKFSINESFNPQAGWKISLLDNSGSVLSTVDSADVSNFAASGELSLSGSYDSAKIAYVKVEKSDTSQNSNAEYQLIFAQHQQISEDDSPDLSAVSLIGDIAHYSTFSPVGGSDTDTYLFETTVAEVASTFDITLSTAGTDPITLTIRTLDGGSVFDSDGSPIELKAIANGESITMQAAASATAYKLELTLTSDSSGDYSFIVVGLAARANGPAQLTVDDLVGSDYLINTDFSAEAEAKLTQYLVNTTTGLDLTSVFKAASLTSNLDKMYFMSDDVVPGIGTFSTANSIVALDYVAASSAQHIDLSTSYASGNEFTIWGFAVNESLIADNTVDGSVVGQHNASAIMGARFKVTDQGVTSAISDSTIKEGESTTLTLSLSQALTGDEEISVSLTNTSSDLSFSSDQVTFDASNQTIAVTVTAIAGDADFSEAESVGIGFTVTTPGFTNLLISSLNVVTSEDTPSFSITTQNVALVSDSSNYQYTISLDNADSFTESNPATVSFSVLDGFIISTSADVSDAVTDVAFSSTNTSASLFVLSDTTTVSNANIPSDGLESNITHSVTIGSITIANAIDNISVTRAVIHSNSEVSLSGTSAADVIIGTEAQESINSLASDDSFTYVNNSDIKGDTLDGGDGTDVVNLSGAKTDYTIVDLGNQTYSVTQGSSVLNLSNIENVSFSGASAVALNSLNEPPIVNTSHGLVNTDFSVSVDQSKAINLANLFTDPEGDTLSFYFNVDGGQAPSWTQFDSLTNILTLMPTNADIGTYSLTISASDKVTALSSPPVASFTVSITESPVIQLDDTSQKGLTNLTLGLYKDNTSLDKSVVIDNSSVLITESVTFDTVKLSATDAYDFDINISDAIDVLRHIVDLQALTPDTAGYHAADVDNNGSVNISDAIDILRHIVDLETIDFFDVLDSSGARVTQLDVNASGDAQTWTLVANGDVDMSGSFADNYIVESDLV
jgi:hypothetical protein